MIASSMTRQPFAIRLLLHLSLVVILLAAQFSPFLTRRAAAAPLPPRPDRPAMTPRARLAVDDSLMQAPALQSKLQIGLGARITVTTFDPNLAADGRCSLIEAIANANADAAVYADCPAGHGPDIIYLAPGSYTLTQVNDTADGENGLPSITSVIAIVGHGATITRSAAPKTPAFRIFRVAPGGTLALRDLTVSNGLQSTPAKSGAGIRNQGGTLRLQNVTVHNNRMEFGYGGGIYSWGGELSVVRSTVVENTVTERYGGGIYHIDGKALISASNISHNLATSTSDYIGGAAGVFNVAGSADSTMTIEDSVISDNIADGNDLAGGGIGNAANDGVTASLHLERSSVMRNQASYGGGIWNTIVDGETPNTQLFIERSTIADNRAIGQGSGYADSGGLENFAATAVIVNSTFSGNRTTGDVYATGGGISNQAMEPYPAAFVHLVNSTLANNTASHDGGGVSNVLYSPGAVAEITFANTLLAGNAAPVGASCFDGGATLTSLGHNLEDGDACGFHGIGDKVGADPRLDLLGDNGGPTLTHALLPGSPAMDAGDIVICAAPPVNNMDQRGVRRLQSAACDIGAYEY